MQEPQGPAFSRRRLLAGKLPHAQESAGQEQQHGQGSPQEDLAPYEAAMQQYWLESRKAQLPALEALQTSLIVPLEHLDAALHETHPQHLAIAHLLSQAYQLVGILWFHRNDLRQRAQACQRGVMWAQKSQDPHLVVAASLKLGVTFHYAGHPQQALNLYETIRELTEEVSPLLQGSFWMKWAASQAQVGQEREALEALEKVYDLFPAAPEQDPAFAYADCGGASLALWDGLTYLALGDKRREPPGKPFYVEQASHVFQFASDLHWWPSISTRNDVEIVNALATTAILLEDLDLTERALTKGITGARSLYSARRYAEAIDNYRLARQQWPEEWRIRRLAAMFIEDLP